MRLTTTLLAAALAVACSPAGAPDRTTAPRGGEEAAPGAAAEHTADRSPAGVSGDAGMKIWIDPETGRRLPPPRDAVDVPSDPEAVESPLSRSDAGLSERPVPGGGVVVHLAGRFRSETRATLRPDGSLEVDCVTVADDPGAGGEADDES